MELLEQFVVAACCPQPTSATAVLALQTAQLSAGTRLLRYLSGWQPVADIQVVVFLMHLAVTVP